MNIKIKKSLQIAIFTFTVLTSSSLFAETPTVEPLVSFGFNTSQIQAFTDNTIPEGKSTNFLVTYTVNPKLAFSTGYNVSEYARMVADLKSSKVDKGLTLGMDYYFDPMNETFSPSLNLSATNSFTNFSNFKNYHVDLVYRINFPKSFYVGAGVNYTRNNISEFSSSAINNANAVLQIGFRDLGFYIGKKSK